MRVALAVPSPHDYRLAREAARHGHEIVVRADDGDTLAESVQTSVADVAIVWATPQFLGYSALTACDGRGVRVLAAVTTDDERRYASGMGLYDLVDGDAEWEVFEALIHGDPDAPAHAAPEGSAAPAAAGDARTGTVVTVWGPAGSPGRTTLAIGIAAELAAAGHSVVLADVDTHGASIAPALGMMDEAPGFAAACRLAGADSLTRAELERIGQRYRANVAPAGAGAGADAAGSPGRSAAAGLWVLTGIGQPSRWPELSAERVAATIAECRRWADFVVLDTASSLENDEEIASDLFSPRRNAATLTALREADHVVAVAAADPVGLARFLRAHGELADVIVTDSVIVVANKIRGSAIGLNPNGQVTQTLARFGGIDEPALIPWDQQAMDAAVLSGRTLADVAPKSPARLAIQRLVAERLLPEPAAEPRRRGVAGSRLWRR